MKPTFDLNRSGNLWLSQVTLPAPVQRFPFLQVLLVSGKKKEDANAAADAQKATLLKSRPKFSQSHPGA